MEGSPQCFQREVGHRTKPAHQKESFFIISSNFSQVDKIAFHHGVALTVFMPVHC